MREKNVLPLSSLLPRLQTRGSKENAFLSYLPWMELDRTCFCFWWNWPDFFWCYWTSREKQVFVFWGKLGNQARSWQSGKILATWQDFGNQARFWQLDKILAIGQDFGNLAIDLLKIFCSILPNYRRRRGISTTSRHISFEFLFIKTCPPDKYITDSVSSFNSASESDI
jgi:hypothetical protein